MTADERAIEIREESNGRERYFFLVGEWPERTAFAFQVIDDGVPELIRKDGRRIAIMLASGSAVYRIDETDADRRLYHCSRES